MARVRRRTESPAEGLNLTPIMNLVLILIPLLLLSVVFNEVTTVAVAMPQEGLAGETGDVKPRLAAIVSADGIAVLDHTMQMVDPNAACGLTVCAQSEVSDPVERYDWLSLYNALLRVKQDRPEFANVDLIEINATQGTTWNVVVRLMDISRWQLASAGDATRGEQFSSTEELYAARPVILQYEDGRGRAPLFPQPQLEVPGQ